MDYDKSIKKYAIIIPTYNRKKITSEIVRKINLSNSNFKIIICDSNSDDGTAELISKQPNVNYLNVKETSYWSAAVNYGIKEAISQDYNSLIIMNDDISFNENFIENIIKVFEKNPNNIISPVQMTNSGEFWGTNYLGIFKNNINITGTNEDILVETSNGCCLVFSSNLIKLIGFFNEKKCPHYYADIEFQLRASKLGYKTLISHSSVIYQLSNTDNYSKLRLGNIFIHKVSPLNFIAYAQFGYILFNSRLKFLTLGLIYHYNFIKSFLKYIVLVLVKNDNK